MTSLENRRSTVGGTFIALGVLFIALSAVDFGLGVVDPYEELDSRSLLVFSGALLLGLLAVLTGRGLRRSRVSAWRSALVLSAGLTGALIAGIFSLLVAVSDPTSPGQPVLALLGAPGFLVGSVLLVREVWRVRHQRHESRTVT
jgi:uncharacterized membrane protein HdeD (DUF308 family)